MIVLYVQNITLNAKSILSQIAVCLKLVKFPISNKNKFLKAWLNGKIKRGNGGVGIFLYCDL